MVYRKGAFHNPISTGHPSFVFGVAAPTKGGTKTYGNYVLTVADCKRMIELEFSLTSPRMRKQSLAKVDLLAEVINKFKGAIHAEAELIDRRERK